MGTSENRAAIERETLERAAQHYDERARNALERCKKKLNRFDKADLLLLSKFFVATAGELRDMAKDIPQPEGPPNNPPNEGSSGRKPARE